jgi:hypothetical protein
MSRLAIPIQGLILWSTGDLRLWVELPVHFKDQAGNWLADTVRVDTATDITTFPAYEAKRMRLPMPQHPSVGARHSQTGLEIRSEFLRFRIDGMDQTEYAVACFFLGDPNAVPAGNPAAFSRKLLQPLALLDQLRFEFDKNATVAVPYGEMHIEKR